jgi:hypothetical protein
MTTRPDRLLLWSPRILGIFVSLFLGLFALDAFDGRKPFLAALPDFFIHLIPAVVVLALVAASSRREWIGGLAFMGLAVLYAMTAAGHLDWVLVISGPLMVVGVLFAWNWFHHREPHPS